MIIPENTSLTSLLPSHGILQLSSCAQTPQQNRVAKRKNKHLIETARTMPIHTHVFLRFWGDVIITACYLINRMPSSILEYPSPHSVLYPDQNLFPVPPHLLGCTCFVHNFTPEKDKQSTRHLNMSFLGILVYKKILNASIPLPVST